MTAAISLSLPHPCPPALADVRKALVAGFGAPRIEGDHQVWALSDPASLQTRLGDLDVALQEDGGLQLTVPFALRSWVQETTRQRPTPVPGKGLNRFRYVVGLPFRLTLFGADCWLKAGGAE